MLGDSVTTDHISPAGSIAADSPAGKYLISLGVQPKDFNSYGARRGNHEVMMRGTLANIRLRNQLAPGTEGGWTAARALGREDVHLRRRHALPAGRRRADHHRGQGVRLRFFPGLGGQGCGIARRESSDRRELRAHSPFEPGRDGRPASGIPAWAEPGDARPRRHGDLLCYGSPGGGGRLAAGHGARR